MERVIGTPQTPNELALSPLELKVLECLLESHDSGDRFQCDPWQFALQLREFEIQNISATTLRGLVQMGLVAHGVEKTRTRSARRALVPVSHLHFTEKSSFLLADRGLALARSLCFRNDSSNRPTPAAAPHALCLPSFVVCDKGCRELRFAGKVAKRFNAYAERQETILHVFQERGWVPWIADPLAYSSGQNPKIRLREAIARLNRHQLHRLLRFQGDGTGRGIRWCRVSSADTREATEAAQSSV